MIIQKKIEGSSEEPPLMEAIKEATPVDKKKRSNNIPILFLTLLCLALGGTSFWLWKQNKELTKPAPAALKRVPNEAEKRLTDSLAIASKKIMLLDSLFGKTIIVGDTIYIRQDSLRIDGAGLTLQRDSSYTGPAFFVTSNCKYLVLENIRFEDFATAITTQSKGLQLHKIVFQNIGVPVQQQLLLPLNDTLTGILRDTFLFKKDSTPK